MIIIYLWMCVYRWVCMCDEVRGQLVVGSFILPYETSVDQTVYAVLATKGQVSCMRGKHLPPELNPSPPYPLLPWSPPILPSPISHFPPPTSWLCSSSLAFKHIPTSDTEGEPREPLCVTELGCRLWARASQGFHFHPLSCSFDFPDTLSHLCYGRVAVLGLSMP